MIRAIHFTERSFAFYPSEEPDKDLDRITQCRYEDAVEDMRDWLTSTLQRDMEVNNLSGASAIIHLPNEDLTVSVGSPDGVLPEMFQTPIGQIDAYTYNAIVKEENPIKEVFDFISFTIGTMLTSLGGPMQEKSQPILTEALLEEYKWHDPLHLHRMQMVLYDIVGFLKGEPFLNWSEVSQKQKANNSPQ